MNPATSIRRHSPPPTGRWFHRLAVLLACVTFPLISVGGLVTTYQAGMAVPDWPSTYGYNLFLYPWQTWLSGPWDLFIEHGHRLLGATAGLVTIGLVLVGWCGRRPRWQKWHATALLLLVVVQGLLGGARVLMNERLLALVHGCVAPSFFALAVALAVVTSRRWANAAAQEKTDAPLRLAVIAACIAALQIVLGALLRHMPVTAGHGWFRLAVVFHLLTAQLLLLHTVLLARRCWRGRRELAAVGRISFPLVGLVLSQMVLGASTWVVQYGWPHWLSGYTTAAGYTIQNESMLQALVTTAHVALGSLILAMAVSAALYAGRVTRWAVPAAKSAASQPQGALA